MTVPTESPRLEAVSIRDRGWTTTDLRLASPRVRGVGSLTSGTLLVTSTLDFFIVYGLP